MTLKKKHKCPCRKLLKVAVHHPVLLVHQLNITPQRNRQSQKIAQTLYSMQQLTKLIIFTVPYMTSSEVEISPAEKKSLPMR